MVKADWKIMRNNNDTEYNIRINTRNFYNDAIRLFTTNKEVKEFHSHKLKELYQLYVVKYPTILNRF